MLKFLYSRSASWSVLLSFPAVGPLFPVVVALLLSSHCPPSGACLCLTAGSRCVCSSRCTSRDIACSSSSCRASDFRRTAHPRADPRVLLVVRWLRQPAFTFFSWSAGCVTSLHVLRVVRWRPACTHSLTARCAWSRCNLWSCGFVTKPLKLCAAVLMALHESPAMALHGLSVQFCFVDVDFLVTVHVHVAILLWSALTEGLRVDAIVWLLQHLELIVSSFLPLGFQGCSPTEACSRHCFGWCLVVSPALSTQSRVY